MPRKHLGRLGARKYIDYSEENLLKAMRAVRSGISYKVASETFGIPRRTLMNKIKKNIKIQLVFRHRFQQP